MKIKSINIHILNSWDGIRSFNYTSVEPLVSLKRVEKWDWNKKIKGLKNFGIGLYGQDGNVFGRFAKSYKEITPKK